eukprot:2203034-Lingulodinium_polyedra.AAC.1
MTDAQSASARIGAWMAGGEASARGVGPALYRIVWRLRWRRKLRRWMNSTARAKRWLTDQGREWR